MHREILSKQNGVDAQKTIEIVKKGSYGVLSTIGTDGYPYGVPLNYTYWNDCICFHCAQQGHKLENIDFTNRVSFCVVTKSVVLANKFDTDYESAIAFGTAVEVADSSEKEEILMSIINKYSPDYIDAGQHYMKKYWDSTTVVKVVIEHCTGKVHV
ncbi:MAG: nitroimidazol reductase NimA-like FMN-containing flavoprotein [Desulforhopalus sp.]|jgi:nitroimidazol reductase NimA-like FMN-containing flavoprotein (pyridoxamine 5'-phosphate oxidase superfamily)